MNATRVLFRSAALFNWAAALILLAPLGLAARLGLEPLPVGSVYEFIAAAAIALFGLGYWWAGTDPLRNRPLIELGLIGKIAVVALVGCAVLTGQANWRLAALASGDLVYAALFAVHLRRAPR